MNNNNINNNNNNNNNKKGNNSRSLKESVSSTDLQNAVIIC